MPRNASGQYDLPTGINPVVPFTTITASWANPTLQDLAAALTDSLSRTGLGGMNAPFRLADGTVAAPGLSFANETGLGLFRPSIGVMGFAAGGVEVFRYQSNAVAFSYPMYAASGSVGAPSISFGAEMNLGAYRSGAGVMSFVSAGAEVYRMEPARVTFSQSISLNRNLFFKSIGGKSFIAFNNSNANPYFYLAPSTSVDAENWDFNKGILIDCNSGTLIAQNAFTCFGPTNLNAGLSVNGAAANFNAGATVASALTVTGSIGATVQVSANRYMVNPLILNNVSGSINVAWATSQCYVLNLAGAVTINFDPSGMNFGSVFKIILIGTGNAISMPNVYWPGGVVPSFAGPTTGRSIVLLTYIGIVSGMVTGF